MVIYGSDKRMGQTVYVDLFFMINFSMDFLCFFLTSQLLGTKLRLLRTVCAAIIGGIYADVALFMSVGSVAAVFIDIAVCVLMCATAFGVKGGLAAHSAVYIAVSMILGGFMTALFGLLNRAKLPLGETEGDGISAWILALLAAISAAVTLLGGKSFRRKSARKYADVDVVMLGKSKRLSAFCDSGNLLRDPISSKPCIVVDMNALDGVLPRNIVDTARKADVSAVAELDGELAKRVRIIPAKTAFGSGMLLAVRADKILLGEKGKMREVDALLALCDAGEIGEGCQALVPSELLL